MGRSTIVEFPPYRNLRTNPEYQVFIHAPALQKLLWFTQLFSTTEVGTYLLTSHDPKDRTSPPPIDSVFLYHGQILARGSVESRPEYRERNVLALQSLNRALIGHHHSHCDEVVFESSHDRPTHRANVDDSAWVVRRCTPLLDALPDAARTYLRNHLPKEGDDVLTAGALERAQLYEETNGFVTIISNVRGHVQTRLHIAKGVSHRQYFDPLMATLRPFLYEGEEPPSPARSLQEAHQEVNDRKSTFIFREPEPYALTRASPQEALESILSHVPLHPVPVSVLAKRQRPDLDGEYAVETSVLHLQDRGQKAQEEQEGGMFGGEGHELAEPLSAITQSAASMARSLDLLTKAAAELLQDRRKQVSLGDFLKADLTGLTDIKARLGAAVPGTIGEYLLALERLDRINATGNAIAAYGAQLSVACSLRDECDRRLEQKIRGDLQAARSAIHRMNSEGASQQDDARLVRQLREEYVRHPLLEARETYRDILELLDPPPKVAVPFQEADGP